MEDEVLVAARCAKRRGQRNTILIKVDRDATIYAAQIILGVVIVLQTRL